MSSRAISKKCLLLLVRLGETGCFAACDPLDDTQVAIYIRRNRMTLGAGRAPEALADELVTAGFAAWREGTSPRLEVTEEGRLFLETHPMSEAAISQPTGMAARRVIETVMVQGPDSKPAPCHVNMAESPLLWLHRRKGKDGKRLISDIAFAAGERLRADITIAGTLPRVTSNWSAAISQGPRGEGGIHASEAMTAAGQRVTRAMQAAGPEFSGLLLDVCGFLKGLEQVERERGWPKGSARMLLVTGLGRLAAHYGMSQNATGTIRRVRSVWQAAGARPDGPFRPGSGHGRQ